MSPKFAKTTPPSQKLKFSIFWLSFGQSYCYLWVSPLLLKWDKIASIALLSLLIIEEITKDNKKITQKITKFRKEALLNLHLWLGGVVLAKSGDIFKHSDKFSFCTIVSLLSCHLWSAVLSKENINCSALFSLTPSISSINFFSVSFCLFVCHIFCYHGNTALYLCQNKDNDTKLSEYNP